MGQATAAGEGSASFRDRLTLGAGLGAVIAVIGAFVGAGKLSDNSFFTHLATGRIILEEGSVPSTDPYTFTAAGEPWVVQSWLASLVYAVLEEAVGLAGPRLLHMALAAAVAAACWWLSRSASSVVPRLALVGLAIGAGGTLWVERPLMIGLACFCGLWVLSERGPVLAIVPLMWVWVNSHGSFPLGGVLVLALLAGRLLDHGEVDRLKKVVLLVAVGTLVGGLASPVAVTILTFPISVLERSDQLQAVAEWRSPDFSRWGPRLFMAQLLLGIIAARRGVRWELVLPAVAFVAAALLGVRNMPLAAVALIPLLAGGAPSVGSLRTGDRGPLGVGLVAVSAAGTAVVIMWVLSGPHLQLNAYPLAEVEALETEGVLPPGGPRIAHADYVGNFLEVRYGATAGVFFDDRFDMYEEDLLQDMIDLQRGRRVVEVLDEHDVDIVLWLSDTAVADHLRSAPGWTMDDPLSPLEGFPEAEDGSTGWSVFRRAD